MIEPTELVELRKEDSKQHSVAIKSGNTLVSYMQNGFHQVLLMQQYNLVKIKLLQIVICTFSGCLIYKATQLARFVASSIGLSSTPLVDLKTFSLFTLVSTIMLVHSVYLLYVSEIIVPICIHNTNFGTMSIVSMVLDAYYERIVPQITKAITPIANIQ